MEYLTVVKSKIAGMDRQLEEARQETEWHKRKSAELQQENEALREKEKLMSMKYGVLISANKELETKVETKKESIRELKEKLRASETPS